MNEIRLFRHELESMPTYRRSLPTGTTLWKMWRRPSLWGDEEVVGQYVPSEHQRFIEIRWFKVVLKYGPAPPIFVHPDWGNFERFKRERNERWQIESQ